MTFFNSVFDFIGDAAGAVGGLHAVAINTLKKHPGKVALVCVGTAATGGAATVFAGQP